MEDHFPVSSNSQISVSLLEAKGALVNQNTGELIWNFTLKPGKIEVIKYIFEVKYPKDWRVGPF